MPHSLRERSQTFKLPANASEHGRVNGRSKTTTDARRGHAAPQGPLRQSRHRPPLPPLPSYDDQNWKVIIQCAQEAIDKIYVLKIAASGAACRGHAGDEATKAALDCEHTMMQRTISASRCVETPSRHRRDSCPSDEVVGGFFFEFEAVRTALTEMLRAGTNDGRAGAGRPRV